MTDFPISALIALAITITVFLCMNAKSVCTKLNLMDMPGVRKKHGVATPLMGGVCLLLALVPVGLIHIWTAASDRWFPTLLIWLSCTGAMALVGMADDRHSLSPRARLLISFLVFASAATIDPTFNIRVLDFQYPRWGLGLGTWWLAVIFTVICCVGLINAVNMADGKNGLVIGLCLGWLGLLAARAPDALVPMIALLGAMLFILLLFNFRGRLFLGDGGAYGLAGAIGLLSIMVYNSAGSQALRAISADELVLLFAIPVLDSFRLTYVRLKQGRSPMSADRNHLHHHLQDRFEWPMGLWVYWGLALVPSAMAIALPSVVIYLLLGLFIAYFAIIFALNDRLRTQHIS